MHMVKPQSPSRAEFETASSGLNLARGVLRRHFNGMKKRIQPTQRVYPNWADRLFRKKQRREKLQGNQQLRPTQDRGGSAGNWDPQREDKTQVDSVTD